MQLSIARIFQAVSETMGFLCLFHIPVLKTSLNLQRCGLAIPFNLNNTSLTQWIHHGLFQKDKSCPSFHDHYVSGYQDSGNTHQIEFMPQSLAKLTPQGQISIAKMME